jgi:UDP-glucose-4-epimerase GalE
MNILVTGGAGFIGSHVAKALKQAGHTPVVVDNLSKGKREAVKWGQLLELDLHDTKNLALILRDNSIEAVIHLAGSIEVGESVSDPLKYYWNNPGATMSLLQAMKEASVDKIVFSSTAAVYGNPQSEKIAEDHPTLPVNPYGRSKLIVEDMLRDLATTGALRFVALRYFNAAGADPEGEIGENHDPESHIIPRACLAILGKVPELTVFGNDWPTPDGTPIRDYIHVTDLASAHVKAVEYLVNGGESQSMNLGTGSGYSVGAVLEAVSAAAGSSVPYSFGPHRAGDPAVLVADSTKAQRVLGWKPEHSSLQEICQTAWNWQAKKDS